MVSSAIAPTDRVGSASKIGANAALALGRIHTPPAAVPTNSLPLTVGSATIAVTRPVAFGSGEPTATPPKVATSASTGCGPVKLHAGASDSPETSERLASCFSCSRIMATAAKYAPRGVPN